MKDDILSLFQGISVVFVFITLIFSTKYSEIVRDISKEKPRGNKAIERFKKSVWIKFFTNIFPQILLLSITVFIMYPTVLEIYQDYMFSISNLDPIISLFVFMYFMIIYLWVWSMILGWLLLRSAYRKEDI